MMHDAARSFIEFVTPLVLKGGPAPSEFDAFTRHVVAAHRAWRAGEITPADLQTLRAALGRTLTLETLQGLAYLKPYGYPGDFEMIDRIYRNAVSDDPEFRNWDLYFQSQAAPQAVRNRKRFLHGLLDEIEAERAAAGDAVGELCPEVLMVGISSGRCIHEWLLAQPVTELHFECLEVDPQALDFAKQLNALHGGKVSFEQRNILRYRAKHPFRLIWVAGLFDYFDEAKFAETGAKLFSWLAPGGELVIGNFAEGNPSQAYMELVGDWELTYRTPARLSELLAPLTGSQAAAAQIRVDAEPVGVNLFLRVKKPLVTLA